VNTKTKVFWFLVMPFVVAAVVWFVVVAASDGSIDAGQAFIGLGYAGGVVLIVLLVLVALQFLNGGAVRRARADASASEAAEHLIIKTQIWVGAGLIGLGAILGVVFGVVLTDDDKVALAIGTAVIGAGAALMPPGAAAGAAARVANGSGGGQATTTGVQPTTGGEPTTGNATE
jgi:hypothetical protein